MAYVTMVIYVICLINLQMQRVNVELMVTVTL